MLKALLRVDQLILNRILSRSFGGYVRLEGKGSCAYTCKWDLHQLCQVKLHLDFELCSVGVCSLPELETSGF